MSSDLSNQGLVDGHLTFQIFALSFKYCFSEKPCIYIFLHTCNYNCWINSYAVWKSIYIRDYGRHCQIALSSYCYNSYILVGKIPFRRAWQPSPVFLSGESQGTEEPGGLQPMGSQTVGHNYVTKYSTRYDSSYLSIFMSKLRVFHHLGFYKSTSNERYQSETWFELI